MKECYFIKYNKLHLWIDFMYHAHLLLLSVRVGASLSREPISWHHRVEYSLICVKHQSNKYTHLLQNHSSNYPMMLQQPCIWWPVDEKVSFHIWHFLTYLLTCWARWCIDLSIKVSSWIETGLWIVPCPWNLENSFYGKTRGSWTTDPRVNSTAGPTLLQHALYYNLCGPLKRPASQ